MVKLWILSLGIHLWQKQNITKQNPLARIAAIGKITYAAPWL